VLCQMCNEVNARSIGNAVNVFHGIFDNVFFVGVLLVTGALQYALVEWPSVNWLVRTTSLPAGCWQKCALLAGLTLPVGGLMRYIPVSDRVEDVAQLPAFVRQLSSSRAGAGAGGSAAGADSNVWGSLSLALWLASCVYVIAHVADEFGSLWAGHMHTMGGSWAVAARALEHTTVVITSVLRTCKLL
jgi:hypothetical protein